MWDYELTINYKDNLEHLTRIGKYKLNKISNMTDPKHTINLLTFSHLEKELTFGFKLKKTNGHSPLRLGEFPRELWNKHKDKLSQVEYLYCDFSTTNVCDYILPVNLSYSTYFAKHYYHYQIHQYFKKRADVCHPNFVKSNSIWFISTEESTTEYKLYYKFSLIVELSKITNSPELVVSFDGTSKVLKKHVLDLVSDDIDTKNLNWLVHDTELIKYEELPDDANNELNEYYPVLNPGLANALHYPPLIPIRNDYKYRNYYRNINHLLNKYLNTEEFKRIIPHTGTWHELDRVYQTSDGANLLKFGNGTHTDPYEGLKKYKPCVPAPSGHYKFFFICHESDTDTANLFHEYSKKEKGFINFNEFLSLPVTYDGDMHINFKNLEDPLPEIKAILSKTSLIPETNYLAIYISPYSKYEADPQKRNFYYQIKQVLLQYKISSQVVYNKNINKDNFKFSVTNIAVAILAKLGGIPWRLDREPNNELIIGVGAFKSRNFNTRYIGSTFCFSNEGHFKGFDCLPADNKYLLAASIREAVDAYKANNLETKRIVIHFYKRMSKEEILPIIRQLKSIGKDIPIVIVTIIKTQSNDMVLFDTEYQNKMPYSGTYIPIGYNSYILCNNTRYKLLLDEERVYSDWELEKAKQDLAKQLKSYPLPVKLHLQSTDESIIEDPEQVQQLIDQVYQFSRMYWKSVSQQNLPVTTKYPEMVAEIFPHFKGEKIPEFGKNNLWFL